ncbi:MAG: hypothetical protein GYA51_02020 [Candidatus Methanofastidiosa archaeon]|nr:hypothetical protein [Candidatus Methanofastidiosa archaeon]
MKKLCLVFLFSLILFTSNLIAASSTTNEQKNRVAQSFYDTGARFMIEGKYTEAKDFFIYCESEAIKCNNGELALDANQMIKNCNRILNLANLNEKAPRNELLSADNLTLIPEEKFLENPNPGGIIYKEYKVVGYNWVWRIQLSSYEYYAYTQMPRLNNYTDLVNCLNNDSLSKTLANDIKNEADRRGYDYYETVNFTLACIQSLPYVKDSLSSGYTEYYRYPTETIVENGDCEDTTILAASILKAMKYDVVLINFPGHIAVGVYVPDNYAPVKEYPETDFFYHPGYSFQGKKYCYIETTGEGWKLGMISSIYANSTPNIISI